MNIAIKSTIFFAILLNLSAAHARIIICPTPSKDAKVNKAEAGNFYLMGTNFLEGKQFADAAESFQCVIELNPKHTMAHFNLARSFDNLGMLKQAREQYDWIIGDTSAEAKALKPVAQKRLLEMVEEDRKAEELRQANLKKEEELRQANLKKAEELRLANQKKDEEFNKAAEIVRNEELRKKQLVDAWKLEQERQADLAKKKRMKHAAPSAPEEKHWLFSQWWFWTGSIATAAFTGATIVTGRMTLDLDDQWRKDHDPRIGEDLNSYRVTTDLLLTGAIISAAALTAGIVLNWPSTRTAKTSTKATWIVLPACGPEGCMMTISLGF